MQSSYIIISKPFTVGLIFGPTPNSSATIMRKYYARVFVNSLGVIDSLKGKHFTTQL